MRTSIITSIILVALFAQLKTSTSAFHDGTTFPSNSIYKLITMVTRNNPETLFHHPSPRPAPEHGQSNIRESSPPIGSSSNCEQENPCKGFITMVTNPYEASNRQPSRHPPPKAAPEKHQEELGISSSTCQPGNSCSEAVATVTNNIDRPMKPPPSPPMPSTPIHHGTNSYGGGRKPHVHPPPSANPGIDQDVLGNMLPCTQGSSCRKTKTTVTDSRAVSKLSPKDEVMRGYRRIANFASSTTQSIIFSWM